MSPKKHEDDVPESHEDALPALRTVPAGDLQIIRSAAGVTLKTALAQLVAIGASEAKLANAYSGRIDDLLALAQSCGHNAKALNALMRRLGAVGAHRGKHYDRVMATTERALVIAQHIGMDIGAATSPFPANATVDGKKVPVTEPQKQVVFKSSKGEGEKGAA